MRGRGKVLFVVSFEKTANSLETLYNYMLSSHLLNGIVSWQIFIIIKEHCSIIAIKQCLNPSFVNKMIMLKKSIIKTIVIGIAISKQETLPSCLK